MRNTYSSIKKYLKQLDGGETFCRWSEGLGWFLWHKRIQELSSDGVQSQANLVFRGKKKRSSQKDPTLPPLSRNGDADTKKRLFRRLK